MTGSLSLGEIGLFKLNWCLMLIPHNGLMIRMVNILSHSVNFIICPGCEISGVISEDATRYLNIITLI